MLDWDNLLIGALCEVSLKLKGKYMELDIYKNDWLCDAKRWTEELKSQQRQFGTGLEAKNPYFKFDTANLIFNLLRKFPFVN